MPLLLVQSCSLLASSTYLASTLFTMRGLSSFILAALSSVGVRGAVASSCVLNHVSTSPPTGSAEVALQSYSYCGGTLNVTAYVNNLSYNKIVTLYFTNRQNESTPLSALSLGYESSVPNSKFEYWIAAAPIWTDGITQLLNITYQDTDDGQTYHQLLDLHVKATGAPPPTLPSPPAPYATPSGFGNDVTQYLAVESGSEAEIAQTGLFRNVNPAVKGAVNGTVVAARSGPFYSQTEPDYAYNWVRDASLTMDVVQNLYSAATSKTAKAAYEQVLFEYAVARATEQTDPNLKTGLGEPKFYLNNTIFSGPWGRPQNDGPATSAITLMEFANDYLASGGNVQTVKEKIYNSSAYPHVAPVQKDLLFVARNWSWPSYDLWEEVQGDQFYTRMVQRRALVNGASFAQKMGDSATSSTLAAAEKALTATMSQFWDPNREIILYAYSPVMDNKTSYLDTAVILGIIHGYAGDNVFSYTNPQVLSTAVRISTSFIDVYPLANKTRSISAGPLGIPVGRYPEDVYNGTGTQVNGGNPWYLCTAAFSQFMYAASSEYAAAKTISVTNVSLPFFTYFAPEAKLQVGKSYSSTSSQFKQVIQSLDGWGDAFMRTIKYYTPAGGNLHEEFNRNTGAPQGASALTWSFASVLTAAFARAELRGNGSYIESLANLGFKANS
ncbi:glucoamylase precursor [Neohortaea acidophila]|uniref:glucan 1,4-alpha-glucosidase n=1 Tax=Neohortaea acidophila TaxID=245834 RepID=A0A6A6PRE2_9PEZI|nr:glucoamylase precursor [Neohortaea acidophila]KAF2482649.1 glucoamylase precursor [Neohortaea acidophila]